VDTVTKYVWETSKGCVEWSDFCPTS